MSSIFNISIMVIIFFLIIAQLKIKRLRAREIVLLSSIISICVILNVLCNKTVPLHAGTAVVVIAGISMGPSAGFFVGALSRFICNFFAGQGPWTPWQMLAWGLIGFMSGMLFNKVFIKRRIPGEKQSLSEKLSLKKEMTLKPVMIPVISVIVMWVLSVVILFFISGQIKDFIGWRIYLFGFLGLVAGMFIQRERLSVNPINMFIFTFFTVFIIYGGIMNFGTFMMSGGNLTVDELKKIYIAGVPYDLFHGFTSALCIFLFGDNLLGRISRIQIKFGIHMS